MAFPAGVRTGVPGSLLAESWPPPPADSGLVASTTTTAASAAHGGGTHLVESPSKPTLTSYLHLHRTHHHHMQPQQQNGAANAGAGTTNGSSSSSAIVHTVSAAPALVGSGIGHKSIVHSEPPQDEEAITSVVEAVTSVEAAAATGGPGGLVPSSAVGLAVGRRLLGESLTELHAQRQHEELIASLRPGLAIDAQDDGGRWRPANVVGVVADEPRHWASGNGSLNSIIGTGVPSLPTLTSSLLSMTDADYIGRGGGPNLPSIAAVDLIFLDDGSIGRVPLLPLPITTARDSRAAQALEESTHNNQNAGAAVITTGGVDSHMRDQNWRARLWPWRIAPASAMTHIPLHDYQPGQLVDVATLISDGGRRRGGGSDGDVTKMPTARGDGGGVITRWRLATVMEVRPTHILVRYAHEGGGEATDISPSALNPARVPTGPHDYARRLVNNGTRSPPLLCTGACGGSGGVTTAHSAESHPGSATAASAHAHASVYSAVATVVTLGPEEVEEERGEQHEDWFPGRHGGAAVAGAGAGGSGGSDESGFGVDDEYDTAAAALGCEEEWIDLITQSYRLRDRGPVDHHAQPPHKLQLADISAYEAAQASEEEQLFLSALASAGFACAKMAPDGNCLFRAVAHQIYGDAGRYADVRSDVCAYMAAHPAFFGTMAQANGYSLTSYVARMRREGEWGGYVEIVAVEGK